MSRRNGPTKLGKTQRQHLVAKLIEQHTVQNQTQLVDLLASEEVVATQATVSRDLEDLGAIKVRVPGGESAYAIPALPKSSGPGRPLAPCLRRLVSRSPTRRTWSCCAPAGIGARGRLGARPRALPEIIGTVAGDDTLVVIVADGLQGSEVGDQLRDLAGL
jgi:transcriptional regulator of arginine metabolism